jgi:hypothetical protein
MLTPKEEEKIIAAYLEHEGADNKWELVLRVLLLFVLLLAEFN